MSIGRIQDVVLIRMRSKGGIGMASWGVAIAVKTERRHFARWLLRSWVSESASLLNSGLSRIAIANVLFPGIFRRLTWQLCLSESQVVI